LPEATSVEHEERKGRHVHPETEFFDGKLRKTIREQFAEAGLRLGDDPFD
jgi:ABC-2 type transport system ATP-binding protein